MVKIFRHVLEQMGKNSVLEQEPVYWSVVEQAAAIFSWMAARHSQIAAVYPNCNIGLYPCMAPQSQSENYFAQLTALAEAQKLRGVKLVRQQLEGLE